MADVTPSLAENVQYQIGIGDLYMVLMKAPADAMHAPVYDTKVWNLSVISKLKVKGNGKSVEKYTSNKLFARVGQETQHELGLDHVGLPVALYDAIRGILTTHGVGFGKTTPKKFPEFALGFVAPQSDGVNNGFWYPRCQLNPAVEHDYETTTDDITIPDTSLTILANGLTYNAVLWSDFNSARESADITLEQFMTAPIYDESQLDALVAKSAVTEGAE